MSSRDSDLYKFGNFVLDASQRVLLRADDRKPVQLTPKAFETLQYLVENHGRLIEKNELLGAVWADSFVEEGNLSANVRVLRKALGDDAQAPVYIQTVARRGYRFIAEVDRVSPLEKQKNLEKHADTGEPEKQTETQAEPGRTGDETVSLEGDTFPVVEPTRAQAAAPPLPPPPARDRFQFFGLVLLSIFLPVGGIFLWQWQKTEPEKTAAQYLWAGGGGGGGTVDELPSARYRKITGIGQATHSAISPDGKFVAYTNTTGGKQSLWLRQLATETNVQLIPPQDENFYGLRFSHSGEYLYFNREGLNLFRIATLGGAPVRVVKTAADGFSISPDDRRVAFIRNEQTDSQCFLIAAGADDGSEERILAARPRASCFRRTVWSPDGNSIIATAGQTETGDANTELVEISATGGGGGGESRFSSQRWYHINSLAWLPDKSGLIVAGRVEAAESNQIWHVAYPGGETRKITDDSTNYANLTITRDADRLLVVQVTLDSYLTLAPGGAPSGTRRLTPAFHGFSWITDRRIAYSSPTNNDSLWLINVDGSEHQQLTYDEANLNPTATPDGKYIVSVIPRGDGYHVWRMNADGSNKIQLTSGAGEQSPAVSPDSRWVFYQMAGENFPTVWKVSIDGGGGGEPVQVTKDYGARPAISPDGRLLAYFRRDAADNNRLKIAVMPLAEFNDGGGDGGDTTQGLRIFTPATQSFSTLKLRWTPDGKAIVYSTETNEFVANLWRQPVNGDADDNNAPPQKLTDFNAERIFDFAWSPDGAQLGIIRGSWNHEVILISAAK